MILLLADNTRGPKSFTFFILTGQKKANKIVLQAFIGFFRFFIHHPPMARFLSDSWCPIRITRSKKRAFPAFPKGGWE